MAVLNVAPLFRQGPLNHLQGKQERPSSFIGPEEPTKRGVIETQRGRPLFGVLFAAPQCRGWEGEAPVWSVALLISPQSLVGQSGDVNLIDLSGPTVRRGTNNLSAGTGPALCGPSVLRLPRATLKTGEERSRAPPTHLSGPQLMGTVT